MRLAYSHLDTGVCIRYTTQREQIEEIHLLNFEPIWTI